MLECLGVCLEGEGRPAAADVAILQRTIGTLLAAGHNPGSVSDVQTERARGGPGKSCFPFLLCFSTVWWSRSWSCLGCPVAAGLYAPPCDCLSVLAVDFFKTFVSSFSSFSSFPCLVLILRRFVIPTALVESRGRILHASQ